MGAQSSRTLHEERRQQRLAEIKVIAARLNDQARGLAQDLLPNGKEADGKFWRVGSIAGEPGQSLCIDITGGTRGHWFDFNPGLGQPEHGDMLDLVALVKFGGRKVDAIAWARSVLGLDGLDPARLATETAKVRRQEKEAAEQARIAAAKKLRLARQLFVAQAGCVPIVDTPAEWYLAGRGIDLACLEVGGARYVPNALAFHPAVWCQDIGGPLPAMIARLVLNGEHVATHRTYLAEVDGVWRKAPFLDPKRQKLVLGEYAGAHIPLWKGSCRATLMQIDVGTDVYCSEGIEDGLSAAILKPDARVIAGSSLSNIGGLVLPEQIGRLVLLAQNDAPETSAIGALQSAITRQQEAGRDVAPVYPPAGIKDWNDLLQGINARAGREAA